MASVAVHAGIVVVVLLVMRWIPNRSGIRGQWGFSAMVGNIGFTYPLVLASGSLAPTIFPKLVIWDLSGNAPIIFLANYIIALLYSPSRDGFVSQVSAASPVEEPKGETPSDIIGALETHEAPQVEELEVEFVGPQKNEEEGEEYDMDQQSRGLPHGPTGALAAAIAESAGDTLTSSAQGSCLKKPPEARIQSRVILKKTLTNLPLLAEVLGILPNIAGVRLPELLDWLLLMLGEPYTALFFLLLGLNLNWKLIKQRCALVAKFLVSRICISGAFAAIVWFLPILPDEESRKVALMGLSCPVGGMMMSYALDLHYDSGLQAAVIACSGIVSLLILFALLVMA